MKTAKQTITLRSKTPVMSIYALFEEGTQDQDGCMLKIEISGNQKIVFAKAYCEGGETLQFGEEEEHGR